MTASREERPGMMRHPKIYDIRQGSKNQGCLLERRPGKKLSYFQIFESLLGKDRCDSFCGSQEDKSKVKKKTDREISFSLTFKCSKIRDCFVMSKGLNHWECSTIMIINQE